MFCTLLWAAKYGIGIVIYEISYTKYHIVIAYDGQYRYSYKRKFVKYSYASCKVVMATHCEKHKTEQEIYLSDNVFVKVTHRNRKHINFLMICEEEYINVIQMCI